MGKHEKLAERCFRCHAPLVDDDDLTHVGIDQQEVEKLNLGLREALADNAPILVFLCHACGVKEGVPSVRERFEQAKAMERGHRERTKPYRVTGRRR